MRVQFAGMLLGVQFVAADYVSQYPLETILAIRTIPVGLSMLRERVSTERTCVHLGFHGEYFCQFAIDTSSHE